MNTRTRLTSLVGGVASIGLALTGCNAPASDTGARQPKPTVNCSPSSTLSQAEWIEHCTTSAKTRAQTLPTSTVKKSPRGYIPVEWGERNWYDNPAGQTVINIWFESYDLHPDCNWEKYFNAPPDPVNGHLLAIKVRVETTEAYRDQPRALNAADFKVFTRDGVATVADTFEAANCLNGPDVTLAPDGFTPASKYSGYIVLDVPSEHGYIDYRPKFAPPTADGFELTY